MKCECLKAALLFKGLCCTGMVSAEPHPIFIHKMITEIQGYDRRDALAAETDSELPDK